MGDWGTQFGMLIEYLFDVGEDAPEAQLLRTDPNTFYQSARVKFDSDPDFANRARERVVRLQSGDDPATQRLWEELMELSRDYLRDTYRLLRVTLTDDDIRGESFYNDMLADVVADLEALGLATISDGALCVFPPGFTGRDGSPLPVIIRKRDGGYNYSTTDLATIRYRIDKLNADRAIYVVGSDQALHFRMIFAVARLAGWLPETADFEHAQIGMVQGTDGTPAADQGRRHGQAERPARRGHRAGRGDPERDRGARPRGEGRDRGGRRHRRDQVRRPVHRAGQPVHLRLGPDDLVPREHRALTCSTPRPGSGPSSAGPGSAKPTCAARFR